MFQVPPQKPLEPSVPLPPLQDAARAGNLTTMAHLLQDKDALDAPDADGRTALHWAAEGHQDVVRALFEAGASLDTPNPRGETALSFAVTYGRAPVVRLLLSAGASREIYRSPEQEEKKASQQKPIPILLRY